MRRIDDLDCVLVVAPVNCVRIVEPRISGDQFRFDFDDEIRAVKRAVECQLYVHTCPGKSPG